MIFGHSSHQYLVTETSEPTVSFVEIQKLNTRIADLEAKIATLMPAPGNFPPGLGPGGHGQLPPPPDSDLHGLNLRVYDLENRVSNLEDRFDLLYRSAVRMDGHGNITVRGIVRARDFVIMT